MLWPIVMLSALAAPCAAGEVQVIDDFEGGVGAWYENDGHRGTGQPPVGNIGPSSEAKLGLGAARVRFAVTDTWAVLQAPVRPTEWVGADCDRVAFWLKGDGSGGTFSLILGNYEHQPVLAHQTSLALDFTDWRRFEVPFDQFQPAGLAPNLTQIVLVQFACAPRKQPVDVLVDELIALPRERGGTGRFFDLDGLPMGGWDSPAPRDPLPVDPLRGIDPGAELSTHVHGVRNHLDLHNPVSFTVDYAEPGAFSVEVGETSGYGGSRLILRLDRQERRRDDFPGETQTTLTDFRGYYGIDVSAGRHVITVDNDGADWIRVVRYRFANYGRAAVKADRNDAAASLVLLNADGTPRTDLVVTAASAGQVLPLRRNEAGAYVTESLRGRFAAGLYPVVMRAESGGQTVCRGEVTVRVVSVRLVPLTVALTPGQRGTLRVAYESPAQVRTPGVKLTGTFDGRTLTWRDREDGTYETDVGPVKAGSHEVVVSGGEVKRARYRVLAYDPKGHPWLADGFIRLSPNGWFMTQDGRTYTPWGYATIGVCAPVLEGIRSPEGDDQWPHATDDALRDWFAWIAAHGVNAIRFGLNVDDTSIGGDRGGHANPFIIEQLRRCLGIAGPMGIKAIPVLWWGHYRNFSFDAIPLYDQLIATQADWFTSAEALKLQQQYVREMVEPFRDDARILAWEVMNETYPAGNDLDASIRWTNEICRVIREVDPNHLITTSAAEVRCAQEVAWMRGSTIDFFNFHAYPSYPGYDSFRGAVGDAVRELGVFSALCATGDQIGGKPAILGECGNDCANQVDYPDFKRLATRDPLWLSFLCGSPGGISWDAVADPQEFEVISRLAAPIDWARFRPARPDVRVTVGDIARDLGNMDRYVEWALERGLSLRFVAAGQPADCMAEAFRPPANAPASPLAFSPGHQGTYLLSDDSRVFLAMVRNYAGIDRLAIRARRPVATTITVRLPGSRTLEVWDLDDRRLMGTYPCRAEARIQLGETHHDFAVVARG